MAYRPPFNNRSEGIAYAYAQLSRWEELDNTTTTDTPTTTDTHTLIARIRQADYITAERLATSYHDAQQIDTTYGTDMQEGVQRTIEQIAHDLPPLYQPPF